MDEGVQILIQDIVKEIVEASRRTLLQEIGTLIEKISEQNNSSQFTKISNLVAVEQPKFKRKSNEEQFKANSKVLLKLNEANENLNQDNVQEAKSSITEAVAMLSHRQKLIQMADRSDLGWRVVQEYESNPLAVDSEDEKKMYKAEARANRKMKAEKSKKSKMTRSLPYKRVTAQSGGRSAVQTVTTQVQRPGLCFQCGKPGHWKRDCPGNTTYNKISICTDHIVNKCLQNSSSNIESENEIFKESDDKSQNVIHNRYNNFSIQNNASCILDDSVEGTAPSVSPVGRLKSHASKWRSVSGDSYIVDVIENGYKLPFKVIPSGTDLKNNKSAIEITKHL
ncbi:uncharacterized protein LOC128556920 [Mercenaria mercenaria]|uniref:uncharacterized protein LOC128556920 n=1 Tax=Mercenaria mercenaria TaxID=6596 RepID=UPI00234F60C9|nr:uncharacterized protein LOC128556920 [Mercenaria mercenaria]